MSVIARGATAIRNGLARLATWSLRTKLIAGGGAALVALVALWFAVGGRGCASRDDVEARVALVSSGLQQAAAQGALKIDQLATGVKRLNAAATAYEADKDAGAFCEALDKLSDEFELGE